MNCIYWKGLFIHLWVFFTLVSLLISRICKQFPPPHHPSIQIISGSSRVALLYVLGNLWLCVNRAGKQQPIVMGSVLCERCQLGTFSSRKYHVLQDCRCILLLRVLTVKWNEAHETYGVEGDGYKAALRNSTIKVHQCFLFHIPEREMSDGSRAGMYTREIYTWRKQNEVIVWKNSWNVDFWHHIVPC